MFDSLCSEIIVRGELEMLRSIWGALKVNDIFLFLFAKSECLVQPGYRQLSVRRSLRVIVTLAEFKLLFVAAQWVGSIYTKKALQGFPLIDYCRCTVTTENTWFLSVVYYEFLICITELGTLWHVVMSCAKSSRARISGTILVEMSMTFGSQHGVYKFPRSDKSVP